MGLRLLSIVIALLGITFVYCEVCTSNSDCTTTRCDLNQTVICKHPQDAEILVNGGTCTCPEQPPAPTVECNTREDCFSLTTLNCQASMRHCYDNKCICDRYPTGK